MNSELVVKPDNDYSFLVTFPFDVSLATILFKVKNHLRDDDSDAIISTTLTPHPTEVTKAYLTLTHAQTSKPTGYYKWQMKVLKADGTRKSTNNGVFKIDEVVIEGAS